MSIQSGLPSLARRRRLPLLPPAGRRRLPLVARRRLPPLPPGRRQLSAKSHRRPALLRPTIPHRRSALPRRWRRLALLPPLLLLRGRRTRWRTSLNRASVPCASLNPAAAAASLWRSSLLLRWRRRLPACASRLFGKSRSICRRRGVVPLAGTLQVPRAAPTHRRRRRWSRYEAAPTEVLTCSWRRRRQRLRPPARRGLAPTEVRLDVLLLSLDACPRVAPVRFLLRHAIAVLFDGVGLHLLQSRGALDLLVRDRAVEVLLEERSQLLL